jgi:hypothetical protein
MGFLNKQSKVVASAERRREDDRGIVFKVEVEANRCNRHEAPTSRS